MVPNNYNKCLCFRQAICYFSKQIVSKEIPLWQFWRPMIVIRESVYFATCPFYCKQQDSVDKIAIADISWLLQSEIKPILFNFHHLTLHVSILCWYNLYLCCHCDSGTCMACNDVSTTHLSYFFVQVYVKFAPLCHGINCMFLYWKWVLINSLY